MTSWAQFRQQQTTTTNQAKSSTAQFILSQANTHKTDKSKNNALWFCLLVIHGARFHQLLFWYCINSFLHIWHRPWAGAIPMTRFSSDMWTLLWWPRWTITSSTWLTKASTIKPPVSLPGQVQDMPPRCLHMSTLLHCLLADNSTGINLDEPMRTLGTSTRNI